MCKPIYMRKYLYGRRWDRAIKKISKMKPDKVAKVALYGDDPNVCEFAAKRLNDQNLIKTVARNAQYLSTRTAAALKMDDKNEAQKIIFGVVQKSGHKETRDNALEKLTDQSLLAQLAKTASDRDVRNTALKKLTDQAALEEVAKDASDSTIRIVAVKMLTDQEMLERVAKKSSDNSVRIAALEKLTDQAVITDIAKNDTDKYVRIAAVEKLTDQEMLIDIARGNQYDDVRKTAVKRIIDHDVLLDFMKNDSSISVREAASDTIPVNKLISLLQSNPKDYCNMDILISISKRNSNWLSDISQDLLAYILSYLEDLELKNADSSSYLTKAIIETYKNGSFEYKNQIRKHAGKIAIRKAGHSDAEDREVETTGCVRIKHWDNTYNTEYLSEKL